MRGAVRGRPGQLAGARGTDLVVASGAARAIRRFRRYTIHVSAGACDRKFTGRD